MGQIERIAALLLICVSTPQAFAYVQTLTPGGAAVSWRGSVHFNLAGNPINRCGIDEKSFRSAVVHGLQRWQEASANTVGFDYWQGTDSSIYEPNSNFNGLSSIYFASNGGAPMPSNVLGLTQVWYNTGDGEILEADIELNDVDYHFTTNPADTSGFGSRYGATGSVFIENVITHELGHVYGLSHSGGLQSTMLFMESPEQAHLGCDEETGIRAIYSQPFANGTITGVVQSAGSAPIFGAHVLAVSQSRGTVLGTGLTNSAGRFYIHALEPGDYFLIAEPFYAGPGSLPPFYQAMNFKVCGSADFSRTVLMSGPLPRKVTVTSGGTEDVGGILAECSRDGAAIEPMKGADSFHTAPDIRVGDGLSAVDIFPESLTRYYKVSGVMGALKVHAVGYSLYSPVSLSVTLKDLDGNEVKAQVEDNVFTGTSGYVNHDAALTASDLKIGDYIIEVTESRLTASSYPAGTLSLDKNPFVMITGQVNPEPVQANYPDNARCAMSENFAAYTSPPGNPPRSSAADPQSDDSPGFCGTIETGDKGSGGGPGPGTVVGWLLPWVFMLGSLQLLRQTTK